MTNEKKLAKELLKHNSLKPQEISSQTRKQIQEMLAKESKRASRFKRASRILWLTLAIWLVIVFILSGILDPAGINFKFPAVELAITGLYVFPSAAIICSIIAYMSSKSATLKQIQGSLADISEELKRQSRDS